MSWLCEKCSSEFEDHASYKKHKTDHQLGIIKDTPQEQKQAPSQESEKQPELPIETKVETKEEIRHPIKLTYVYEGQCETCGRKVDTLEIDIATEHYALAYCVPCKEKKAQRKVIKL